MNCTMIILFNLRILFLFKRGIEVRPIINQYKGGFLITYLFLLQYIFLHGLYCIALAFYYTLKYYENMDTYINL